MIAPIYHELSEKLERYIAENGITGKMPGVLKLSRELGVHHVTLSKAMRLLEKKGLLSINGTKGTFVTERTEKRPRHRVLAPEFSRGRFSFPDVLTAQRACGTSSTGKYSDCFRRPQGGISLAGSDGLRP